MAISHLYGLIGYPLGHSFSKAYFTEKFEKLGLSQTHAYEQFPIPSIEELKGILAANPNLKGLNVTIPYKQAVMPLLDEIDLAAATIGAVNTIKIASDGYTRGYNTDYWGFRTTVEFWDKFKNFGSLKACVLGQGGAAKAIIVALEDMGFEVIKVSRQASDETVNYEAMPSLMEEIGLIVNTTPLGMFPNVDDKPPIPYDLLNKQHYLYDIVYNPLETAFLKAGLENGVGGIYTGLEMLHGQADKAWEIWQKN
jgi:shikimate dehydrogenase